MCVMKWLKGAQAMNEQTRSATESLRITESGGLKFIAERLPCCMADIYLEFVIVFAVVSADATT